MVGQLSDGANTLSTIGRIQDAVANDPDYCGLVFWAFAESGQHPGNRALA